MSALGETFRNARESQGLTLADVAERIHIRDVYLAAIEAENWGAIGPQVYVRGFVRSYARALGIDPDTAVAALGGEAGPAPAQRGQYVPPHSEALLDDAELKPKRRLSLVAGLGMLLAFALVLFVGYQYVEFQHGAPAGDGAAPAVPAAQPARAVAPAMPAAAAPLGPAARADAHANGFGVRLRDSSWVLVVVDGKTMMKGTFPKGTERNFAGRSATVRVGNAGGVDISVGGKDLGPMGGLGDVAERSYQL
jgi:cytoskeletal protein RodZ